MPKRSAQKCSAGDCYNPATLRGRCDLHRKHADRTDRTIRGSSTARLYDKHWRKARKSHLIREPLCRPCKATHRTTPATIVDHIIPHRGDLTLFWDRSNWQSICETCHSIKSTKERDAAASWRAE